VLGNCSCPVHPAAAPSPARTGSSSHGPDGAPPGHGILATAPDGMPPGRGPDGAPPGRGLSHGDNDGLSHGDGDGYNHGCLSLVLAIAASSSGSPRRPHPCDWQQQRPGGDTAAAGRSESEWGYFTPYQSEGVICKYNNENTWLVPFMDLNETKT